MKSEQREIADFIPFFAVYNMQYVVYVVDGDIPTLRSDIVFRLNLI